MKPERIQQIPLSELRPFQNHPFKVLEDAAMQRTVESVARFGVLVPAIARPDPGGGYELIAGHRRLHAAKLAGLETLPVIVRNLDDDAAVILMVDSNLQRETLLPSERAFAYRMKRDAIGRTLGRPKKERQAVSLFAGKKTSQIIAEGTGESYKQVERFIRLTNLIPELLDMVDQKQIAFHPAVELSFLTQEEQRGLLDAMDYSQATPSLSQAQRLKKLSQAGACTQKAMNQIMSEVKKSELDSVTLRYDVLHKFFPRSYTPKQMQDTIVRLLEQWQRRRERDKSR